MISVRHGVLALLFASAVAACAGTSDDDVTAADAAEAPEGTVAAVTDPPVTDPPVTGAPTTALPSSTAPPSTVIPTTATPDLTSVIGDWTSFDGGPDCVCADGSDVRFMERMADPERVVLYFEGGGACFTAETCAFEGEQKTYSSSSDVTEHELAARGGIFDEENAENPLAGYSFVYVPYCTGDVHIGNTTTEYSADLSVRHNGYPNALAALDHLVEAFPDTAELVVAGASAGSIPTPLFGALAADELPDATIVTLGDSSGAYPSVTALNAGIGALWGTTNAIPDWPELQGVTAEEWSIPGLYTRAGEHAPAVTFTKFDFAFDEVQAFFGSLAGVPGEDLVTLIDGNEAAIEAEGVEVASYVAPGTDHTIITGDGFYELEVEGVRLVDWVTDLVGGATPADVHCTTCT